MTPQELYRGYPDPGPRREAAIVHEILAGNVPSWTHKFVEIEPGIHVAPDYLAFGTDDNFCRCPLTPWAAQYLLTHFGYQAPTPKLVELIYLKAGFKLKPITPPWWKGDGHLMRTGTNYLNHNAMIDFSMKDRVPCVAGGHKKDIVSDVALLKQHPRHVIIYGWDEAPNKPIQHEQWVHDWDYEDYSHGLRFVKTPDVSLSGPCSFDMPRVVLA